MWIRGGDGMPAPGRFGVLVRAVEPVLSHFQSVCAVRYEVGAFGPTLLTESTAFGVARVLEPCVSLLLSESDEWRLWYAFICC
jgi:hypothetical protein